MKKNYLKKLNILGYFIKHAAAKKVNRIDKDRQRNRNSVCLGGGYTVSLWETLHSLVRDINH